jgi:hypothetical protein
VVNEEASTNYKRLEELKELMGQRHGRRRQQEEVKLITKEADLEPY